MSDKFRRIDGRPILWTDKSGTTHICEGADVHPGVRLLWTDCQRDVPANAAHLGGEQDATCLKCKNIALDRSMAVFTARQTAKPFEDRNFE